MLLLAARGRGSEHELVRHSIRDSPRRPSSRAPAAKNMASDENSFFGLKVPEGTDRRELYKSQYRAIYTYKMSAAELDQAFREAVTGDGPDGGWSIKNDERVKYVGKLEVQKVSVQRGCCPLARNRTPQSPFPVPLRRAIGLALAEGGSSPSHVAFTDVQQQLPFQTHAHRPPPDAPLLLLSSQGEESTLKVTMEDYPEAGMSALKYYTIQSYTKWCVTPPLSMPPQTLAAATRPRYLPAAPR